MSSVRVRGRRHQALILILLLSMVGTGVGVARWSPLRTSLGLAPAVTSSPQSTPTPVLSKEYIYVGGRLIATEEPGASVGGPAPTNLVATATAETTTAVVRVTLSWTAPAGAVSHYQVERSQSLTGPSVTLAPNPTGTTFLDETVSGETAYLYRVRAVFTSGANSDYSNRDLATTVIFSDDPLARAVTTVKAEHLDQLRRAVNAVRATSGLAAATWTNAAQAGVVIRAVHVEELRTNLDQALSALGIPLAPYTDPSSSLPGLTGVTIKKEHVQELRDRVK